MNNPLQDFFALIAASDAAVSLDAPAATAFAPNAPSVVIEVDQSAL
jgi:hypothetical protein